MAEFPQLAAIEEGFQNVLLNVEVVVDDGGKFLSEFWKRVDSFVDGVVGNVVGGRLRAKKEMIADVLFDEAMAIVAANDGIGEIEILEYGLELAAILFRDLRPKMTVILLG